MSSVPASAAFAHTEGMIPCPRCAAPVQAEQDWCLACGDAARTRLAPTPSWKAPIAIVAIVALLAAIAVAIAFVALTDDDAPVPPSPQTAPAPA